MTYRIISRTVYGTTEISYQRVNDDGSLASFFEEAVEYSNYEKWLNEGNTPETIEL